MSKTIATAIVSILTGFTLIFGIEFDEETRQALGSNIEGVIGGVIVIYGIALGLLRKLTDSPLARGVAGWFGAKDKKIEEETIDGV